MGAIVTRCLRPFRPGAVIGTITDDDGPYQPIDLALDGQFFADVDAGPTVDDYVLVANPHAVPVTVRFTAIRPNGSGLVRDVAVGTVSLAGTKSVASWIPLTAR